jgi:hypothetical protein
MLVVDASVAVAACHTPMGFARDFADTSWSHPRSWRDTLPDVLNDRKDRGFRPLLDVGENELRTLGLTLSAYGRPSRHRRGSRCDRREPAPMAGMTSDMALDQAVEFWLASQQRSARLLKRWATSRIVTS